GVPGRGRGDGVAALPQRRPAEPAAVRRPGGRLRAAGRRTDPARRHAGQPDALDPAAAGQGAAVAPDLAALAALRVAARGRRVCEDWWRSLVDRLAGRLRMDGCRWLWVCMRLVVHSLDSVRSR